MTRTELRQVIVDAYEKGVTLDSAERYAALFLEAQLSVSEQLKNADLDRRMRKRGLKALKAGIRSQEIAKNPAKKPTEGVLEDTVALDPIHAQEEEAFDTAEVESEALERDYNIFREAHIYMRGVAKGNFGG